MATEKRKIAIGSDHAAWEAKNAVIAFLEERGKEEVINCGTNGPESVDYPDFANKGFFFFSLLSSIPANFSYPFLPKFVKWL